MIRRLVFLLLICPVIFSVASVTAQTGQPVQAVPPGQAVMKPHFPPPVQYVAPGIFRIGQCTIKKAMNRVEFPATVNMTDGLLEYLVVGDAGKLHESLLATDVSPYALNIALLLSGLEGTLAPLAEQGQAKTPGGDRVKILLRYTKDGKEQEIEARQLIRAKETIPAEIPWVYTGSIVMDGVFMAEAERSLIALFHDPVALLDHQLPAGASDEIWFVNEKTVPPQGTQVVVVIEKK